MTFNPKKAKGHVGVECLREVGLRITIYLMMKQLVYMSFSQYPQN